MEMLSEQTQCHAVKGQAFLLSQPISVMPSDRTARGSILNNYKSIFLDMRGFIARGEGNGIIGEEHATSVLDSYCELSVCRLLCAVRIVFHHWGAEAGCS